MEEDKDIQSMFGDFKTIINELWSLGKTYENYDYIDKILRSLFRKWRPLVTTLRAVKNLDSMSIEELAGTSKVHELKLQHDKGIKKGKSLTLSAQKTKKSSVSTSKSMHNNAFKAYTSSDDEFDE